MLQRCDGPRRYLAGMLTSRDVQMALRQLFGTARPEDIADETGVDRATVYRILGPKPYCPRFDQIAKIIDALGHGITVSAFFARIEGLQLSATDSKNVGLHNTAEEADGRHPIPPARPPLDDTNAVIHRNTEAFIRLTKTLERLAAGDTREQAPTPHSHKPARPSRRGKTG